MHISWKEGEKGLAFFPPHLLDHEPTRDSLTFGKKKKKKSNTFNNIF